MTFLDKTFCASPDCKNECGRKMSEHDLSHLELIIWRDPKNCPLVSYAYFCGEPKLEEIEE